MKSVNLSETELELIVSLYEAELEDIEKYIETLQDTLLKLKASRDTSIETPVPEQANVNIEPHVLKKVVAVSKKRGRKPKSEVTVLKTLPEPSMAKFGLNDSYLPFGKITAQKPPKRRRKSSGKGLPSREKGSVITWR